jgi:hypothetical protein
VIISKDNAERYYWGDGCEGWPLVDLAGLSLKQEKMLAGTAEVRHYHKQHSFSMFLPVN